MGMGMGICGKGGVWQASSKNTTRENPSSSAGFVLTSSVGRRATNKALQLLLSSNACHHALLLVQIVAALVQYRATAKLSTCSVFPFHRY